MANLSCIESIHKVRLSAIEALLNLPYDVIDRYEVKPYRGCSVTYASSLERETCDTITYGSITVSLKRATLWPRQQPEDILLNIEALAAKIREMRVLTVPNSARRLSSSVHSHESCVGLNFQHLVWQIMDSIMSPVLECHRAHMAAQIRLLQ